MRASVYDSCQSFPHSVDIPYVDEVEPSEWEYRQPYLDTTELGDYYAQTEEMWEIEEQAVEEGWDAVPDWTPEDARKTYQRSKPADRVDYSEANHLYLTPETIELMELIQRAARKIVSRVFNPRKRVSTSTTVPVEKKEVPIKKAAKIKYIGVNKMGRSVRIPLDQWPLYKIRGWKEMITQ
jgi:hypothetical protein